MSFPENDNRAEASGDEVLEQNRLALAQTQALYHVAQSLIEFSSLPGILQAIVDIVAEVLSVNRVSLITFDLEARQVIHFVLGGVGAREGIKVSFDELWDGLSGWTLREMKPALSPKNVPDPRESPEVQRRRTETNCGAIIVVPLHYQGKILGTMTVINHPEERDFTQQDMDLVVTIANQCAVAIENAHLYQELQSANAELERRVVERTAELTKTNVRLHQEIAEREKAKQAHREINRAYRALSGCNQVLLRATSENELLQEVCHVIRNECGYDQVWIGFSEAYSVRLVAQAGFEKMHFETPPFPWVAIEQEQNLIETAIQTQRPVIFQNAPKDTSPLDETGSQRPMASAIFPLLTKGYVLGTLNVSSMIPDAFETTEVDLLMELAMDLAYGITSLRERSERASVALALQASEQRYRQLVENMNDGLGVIDQNLVFTYGNQRFCDLLGYPSGEIIGRPFVWFLDAANQKIFYEQITLRQKGEQSVYELDWVTKNGDKKTTLVSGTPIFSTQGEFQGSLAVITDITGRKRVQGIMQARLRLLEFASTHSMGELLTATLDEIEALTGSTIGFYHFLESDQKTLSLQNWSSNTLKNMCTAEGKGSHYDIAQAGVWVDCVGEQRPVIHNDYASLPHRKGLPEGHAPVIRELVVPIFRGGLIKAIIGVGNKPTPYNENDIGIVSQMGDLSWDITEHKRAEEALKDQYSTLRSISDSTNAPIFSVDRQYRYTSFNQAHAITMKAIYGAEIEIGRSILGYMTVEEDRESAKRNLDRALAGEQIVEEAYSGEELLSRRYFQVSHGPIRAETKEIIGVAVLVQDMTERKRTEEALRASGEHLRAVVSGSPVILFVLSSQGTFTLLQGRGLNAIGLEPNTHIGESALEVFGQFIPDIQERFTLAMAGEETGSVQTIGNMIFDLRYSPLRNKAGEINGVIGVATDITEQLKAEKLQMELEKEQELIALKERLIATATHDFRTPLTIIKMSVNMMTRYFDQISPEQRMAKLQQIGIQVDRMNLLLEDVLTMSKANAGKLNFRPERVALKAFCEEIWHNVQHIASKTHTVDFVYDCEIDSVVLDPNLIHCILVNLLSNAVKYSPYDGHVCFEVRHENDYLVFRVSDNGIGIPKQDQAKLFEPFHRATNVIGIDGTGLGLSIVKSYVETHNGRIEFESAEGQGTTFTIYIAFVMG